MGFLADLTNFYVYVIYTAVKEQERKAMMEEVKIERVTLYVPHKRAYGMQFEEPMGYYLSAEGAFIPGATSVKKVEAWKIGNRYFMPTTELKIGRIVHDDWGP